MMEPCVYVLTNVRTKLFYIGYTKNIDNRLKAHMSQLKSGTHSNVVFQKNFLPGDELRCTCFYYPTIEESREAEIEFIHMALNGPYKYLMTNILISKGFGDALTHHPNKDVIIARRMKTSKEKISRMTPEDRKKRWSRPGILNPMYGKTHTEETRKKLSSVNMGNHRGLGRKLSSGHIEKISERAKLRLGDKNSFYGKHHSEKTKQFLREKFKGQLPVNAIKISAEGKEFGSYAEAARFFNISNELVRYRINKSKYTNWYKI